MVSQSTGNLTYYSTACSGSQKKKIWKLRNAVHLWGGTTGFSTGLPSQRASDADWCHHAFQIQAPAIKLGAKLVSSDPADVAVIDNYKAIALRLAKMLAPSVSEAHMVDSIDKFMDLETELAKVGISCSYISQLTHWGRDKMDPISQTTSSSSFSLMKMFEWRLNIHWNLFLRVQLAIFQHWFR